MRNIRQLGNVPVVKKDGVMWKCLEYLADHQTQFLTVEQIVVGFNDKKGRVAPRMSAMFSDGLVTREKVKNPIRYHGKGSGRYGCVYGFKISENGLQTIGRIGYPEIEIIKHERKTEKTEQAKPEPTVYTNLIDRYKGKKEQADREAEREMVLARQAAIEGLTAKHEKEPEPATPEPKVIVPKVTCPKPTDREIEFGKMVKVLKSHGIDALEISFPVVREVYQDTVIKNKTEQLVQKSLEIQKLHAELEELKENKV
jgi:hypothetical protein